MKRGDLLISISTGGKSPSLSAKIRKELEESYGEEYEEYVNILGQAREYIIKNVCDVGQRRRALRELLDLNIDELRKIIK